VEAGVEVNKENNDGETVLFKACLFGNVTLVRYLVEAGAEVNKENKVGETPLFNACRNGNLTLVKYLVEHKAYINIWENSNSLSDNFFRLYDEIYRPQCSCQWYGQHSYSNIIKKKVILRTPLYYACRHGDIALVKYLVEQGALIYKGDDNGSPLGLAKERNYQIIINYLEEQIKNKGEEEEEEKISQLFFEYEYIHQLYSFDWNESFEESTDSEGPTDIEEMHRLISDLGKKKNETGIVKYLCDKALNFVCSIFNNECFPSLFKKKGNK